MTKMLPIRYRSLYWVQRMRILKYRYLSTCARIEGYPIVNQPIHLVGEGRIVFRGRVYMGVFPSPHWLAGYSYLEARRKESAIEIEDGVYINNNCVLLSAGPGIHIGRGTMLGWNCEILDSDLHDTHPDRRLNGTPKSGKVEIGRNVMIGPNVVILKGVKIGDNSVISNGTVVTRSVPANTLVYGNPARGGRLFDSRGWAPSPATNESR